MFADETNIFYLLDVKKKSKKSIHLFLSEHSGETFFILTWPQPRLSFFVKSTFSSKNNK